MKRTETGELDFDALIGPHLDAGYRTALAILQNPDEAHDAVQESAFKAWRKLHQLREGSPARPWFLAIVYRLSCRRTPSWLPLPPNWDRPAVDTFMSPMDPQLVAVLRELPMRQRAALWLRYCDDLSVADVARIMRCTDTAAKQLLLRGRDALRARLTSRLKEDI